MTRIIRLIATVAPFLMLAPTAYLVAWRTVQHLGWPLWVAVVAAVGLEALGLVIAVTGLDAWTWNRSKRKTDPAAPVVLPVVLLAIYFVSAEALTFGLDIASGPVTFAKLTQAVFPVLGLAGMVTLAVRYDHEQRRAEVADGKAAAKAERAAKKAQQPQLAAIPDAIPVQSDAIPNLASKEGMVAYVATKSAKVRELADLHPGWNLMQLATYAHCSVSTASRALASGNGHERIGVVEGAQDATR